MGLTGDIKAKVLGTWAPHCYHTGAITIPNAVRIDDALGGMYHQRGPMNDNSYSGEEAYQAFIVPIERALKLDEYMYAVVCDNQKGVPWQKKMTQDERRAANTSYAAQLAAAHPNYVKYLDDCEIVDGGIVRASVDGVAPVIERMLMDEVMKNSTLRMKLMGYFCQKLYDLPIPANRVLRFDYDYDGPWYFVRDEAPRQCIERGTNLGEYDITANFIASEYVDHPIIFHTADTDTIPLVVSLLSTGTFKQQVVWIFAAGGYVDCHRMVRDTLASTGMTARMFILACILCGTDFFKKSWLTHFIGDDAIFSAVKQPQSVAAFNEFEKHAASDYTAIVKFVSWCHTARLDPITIKSVKSATVSNATKKRKLNEPSSPSKPAKKKRKVAITSWPAKGCASVECIRHIVSPMDFASIALTLGKRFRLPTSDELEKANTRIQFNLWYWTIHWKAPKLHTFEQWRASIDEVRVNMTEEEIDELSVQRLIEIGSMGLNSAAQEDVIQKWNTKYPTANWGGSSSSSAAASSSSSSSYSQSTLRYSSSPFRESDRSQLLVRNGWGWA